MPKQVNRVPGIKPLTAGGYQARVSHRGFEESQNFKTLDDARRWQNNLKADLQRAPEGIVRASKQWTASAIGASGVVSEPFAKLDDAVHWLNQTKVLLSRGEELPNRKEKVLLETYSWEWLESDYSDNKSRKGTYASQLRLHVNPYLGSLDLREITANQLDQWVQDLGTHGVGTSTIRGACSAVSRMLKKATKAGIITKTPWVNIEVPSAKRSPKAKAFNERDLLDLSEACGKYRLLVLILGLCGLRIGEATYLKKKHFDFKANTIHVIEAWATTRTGKRIPGPPKNGEPREVPIPGRLRKDLLALVLPLDENDFLFVGERGGALNSDHFREEWFKPGAKSLEIHNAGVHMLRHTCASLLLRIGTPITTVSAILGHSGVDITLKTYAHFYVEDSFAAMAKLSDHIDSFTE